MRGKTKKSYAKTETLQPICNFHKRETLQLKMNGVSNKLMTFKWKISSTSIAKMDITASFVLSVKFPYRDVLKDLSGFLQ